MSWKFHLSPCYFEKGLNNIDYVSMRYVESSTEFDALCVRDAFWQADRTRHGLMRSPCVGDFLSCTEGDTTRWFLITPSGFPEFELVKTSREAYLVPLLVDTSQEIAIGLVTI